MLSGRAVYRENRLRDGVTYELVVYAMAGGLYGTLTCPVCGTTEVNSALSATEAEALNHTISAIDSHHPANHTTGTL
ncbi:MAG: hypothetical protein WD894_11820 [Pirellulales bacterium]